MLMCGGPRTRWVCGASGLLMVLLYSNVLGFGPVCPLHGGLADIWWAMCGLLKFGLWLRASLRRGGRVSSLVMRRLGPGFPRTLFNSWPDCLCLILTCLSHRHV